MAKSSIAGQGIAARRGSVDLPAVCFNQYNVPGAAIAFPFLCWFDSRHLAKIPTRPIRYRRDKLSGN
jgi:hypothetical protein